MRKVLFKNALKFCSFTHLAKYNAFAGRTKQMDRSWQEYLFTQKSDPNKKSFMDISNNQKIIKMTDLEKILINKTLLDPFRSKKEVNFNLQEITEGKAKIIIPEKDDQYDPDAKFDLFALYNIVMV